MWKTYRESKKYIDYLEYKHAQNKAVKEYRKAKKQFEKSLAKNINKNPKSFYSYVRSKTTVKETIGPIKDSNNEYITDTEQTCEELNNYFASVFTDESNIRQLPEVKKKFKW